MKLRQNRSVRFSRSLLRVAWRNVGIVPSCFDWGSADGWKPRQDGDGVTDTKDGLIERKGFAGLDKAMPWIRQIVHWCLLCRTSGVLIVFSWDTHVLTQPSSREPATTQPRTSHCTNVTHRHVSAWLSWFRFIAPHLTAENDFLSFPVKQRRLVSRSGGQPTSHDEENEFNELASDNDIKTALRATFCGGRVDWSTIPLRVRVSVDASLTQCDAWRKCRRRVVSWELFNVNLICTLRRKRNILCSQRLVTRWWNQCGTNDGGYLKPILRQKM